ncbi:MAG TPA: tRNA (adenosine(37)-N6)-threonylcarbamoyltransferase complex ATPase subunit type 1 TsaE [Bacteroidia bacterium]|nr:tRNA (adenosine(37)-N6)-threonylcarbamoyltransferase complex ATPase subunit type 1 TsaE [Bacteroidia bacterium]
MEQEFRIKTLNEIGKTADLFLKTYSEKKIFAFHGNMGAGKTTFIKALCQQLGTTENTSSPTFSIVNEYKGKNDKKIFHFDFYRIKNESEALDLGYEDYFYSNAFCFIEWPEKINSLIPENTIHAHFTVNNEERIITVI